MKAETFLAVHISGQPRRETIWTGMKIPFSMGFEFEPSKGNLLEQARYDALRAGVTRVSGQHFDFLLSARTL